MSNYRGAVGVAALMATCIVAVPARADVTYSDTEFANASWGVIMRNLATGGTSTGVQTTGGNPGFGREVTNNVNLLGTVYGIHVLLGASNLYTPSVSGAIGSLDFSIDYRWLSGIGGQGQGISLAAIQGSSVYHAVYGITGSTGFWGAHVTAGLVASDFVLLGGGVPIDFSASASPIAFGFVVGNYAPDQAYTNTVLYDNFSVTVHTVPAPGAVALVGLGGLMAGKRRRR